jgi:hypothetical protein
MRPALQERNQQPAKAISGTGNLCKKNEREKIMKFENTVSLGLLVMILSACGSGTGRGSDSAAAVKTEDSQAPVLVKTMKKQTNLGNTTFEIYTGTLKTDTLAAMGEFSYTTRKTTHVIGNDGHPTAEFEDTVVNVKTPVYLKGFAAGTATLVAAVPSAVAQILAKKPWNAETKISRIDRGMRCSKLYFPGNASLVVPDNRVDCDVNTNQCNSNYMGIKSVNSADTLMASGVYTCIEKKHGYEDISYTDQEEILGVTATRYSDQQNFEMKTVNELGVKESKTMFVADQVLFFEI